MLGWSFSCSVGHFLARQVTFLYLVGHFLAQWVIILFSVSFLAQCVVNLLGGSLLAFFYHWVSHSLNDFVEFYQVWHCFNSLSGAFNASVICLDIFSAVYSIS